MSNYVLVADASAARILKAKGARTPAVLEEILTFIQPSSRLRGRELTSDRTGRVFDRAAKSGAGTPSRARHGAQSDFDPHAAEVERFAKRLGRRLDDLRRSGELEGLHIVAAPQFLGVLRTKLSKPTRELVQGELARDMVHARPADIAKAVSRGPR